MYNVPSDNSCLFWTAATAYLLPVRNNNKKFKNRFIQLFGEENLKYLQLIQKLLKQYYLENNRNLNQLWYQNQIANNLVTIFFRNRVVDYIKRNLSIIPNRGVELTFRELIEENNEIAKTYLKRMRDPSTWGGVPEIIAIANILNTNIGVNNDEPYQPINQNSIDIINIFHVNNGTHYNFSLLENVEVSNKNSQEKNIKNKQKSEELEQAKTNIIIPNKSDVINNKNVPSVNKLINKNKNIKNLEITTNKAINKYNFLSKEEKQKKLNEINQH